MKTLHLHIGRHKSGTSSLQHIFSSKPELLSSNNYYYPCTGRNNTVAHHALARAFNQRFFGKNKDAELLVRELRDELNTVQEENIIISSEAFQNISRPGNLSSFFGLFKEVFVYVYFREPLDYLQSAYRQKVQNSNYAKTFEQYSLETKFDYNRFYESWSKVSDKILIRFFHKGFLKDNDIIEDLFELLNIDTSFKSDSIKKNPSIGGNLLYYKQFLNTLELHENKVYNGMMQLASQYPRFRSKFNISESLSDKIRTTHQANLNFLKDHFGSFDMIDFSCEQIVPDLDRIIPDIHLIFSHHKLQKLLINLSNTDSFLKKMRD